MYCNKYELLRPLANRTIQEQVKFAILLSQTYEILPDIGDRVTIDDRPFAI